VIGHWSKRRDPARKDLASKAMKRLHTLTGDGAQYRMQDFRRLRVWHLAHELLLAVKEVVRSFPKSVPSDFKSQLVRAADSVASNIVEGCGAATQLEFARYLDISLKSGAEVDYRLELAKDEGSIGVAQWQPLARKVTLLRKQLFQLRKAVVAAAEAEERERERRADRTPNSKDGQDSTKRNSASERRSKTKDQQPITNDQEPTTND